MPAKLAGMSKKKPRPVPTALAGVTGLRDAHTHLTSMRAELEQTVEQCRAAGVAQICTVGDGLAEAQAALDAARRFDSVFAACAIHPTKAHTLDDDARRVLTELIADPNCVAVGETGLDTYWIRHDPENTASLEVQEAALRWHIDAAVAAGKPLMIHNREADEQLLQILGESGSNDGSGAISDRGPSDREPSDRRPSDRRPSDIILHCFSSPLDVAEEAISRGYILSFAGNITFKRNEELRAAVARCPLDQLLIETDAPYMTPEPFRGAANSPEFIGHTYQAIAEVRGIKLADLVAATAENFRRVYQLPA